MNSQVISVLGQLWESCWFFRLNVVFVAVGLCHFVIF